MSNKILDTSVVNAMTEVSNLELNETGVLLKTTQESNFKIQALADKIHERTSHYDAASKDIYKGKKGLGFFEMAFRYATFKEKFFFGITAFCIFIYGGTRPLFSLMFG